MNDEDHKETMITIVGFIIALLMLFATMWPKS